MISKQSFNTIWRKIYRLYDGKSMLYLFFNKMNHFQDFPTRFIYRRWVLTYAYINTLNITMKLFYKHSCSAVTQIPAGTMLSLYSHKCKQPQNYLKVTYSKKIAAPNYHWKSWRTWYLQLLLVGCSDDRGQYIWQSFSRQIVQETPKLCDCRHWHIQHLNQLQHTRNNINGCCVSFGIISVALWRKQDCIFQCEACLGGLP